jgi:hypothetical protein
MPGIIIAETWLCSPTCATEYIETMESPPELVVFHDPQYQISREKHGVDDDCVDISRRVDDFPEAFGAVEEIRVKHSCPFRVSSE